MPRYYRRRYTRTLVKPKKKWASNILSFENRAVTSPYAVTLVQNSLQSSNPTPVIVKTGNFKVSIDCYFSTGTSTSANFVVQIFILYVPEGWATANISGIVESHPEWIMGSKTVGGSFIANGNQFNLETLNMSTRLKRNLNSGDGIVMLFVPSTTVTGTLYATGHVRYWTCAN